MGRPGWAELWRALDKTIAYSQAIVVNQRRILTRLAPISMARGVVEAQAKSRARRMNSLVIRPGFR